jgi:hypothetical protein
MPRIIVLLIVLGLVVYLTGFLPLPQPFPTLIWVAVVLTLIWAVLGEAGYAPGRWWGPR